MILGAPNISCGLTRLGKLLSPEEDTFFNVLPVVAKKDIGGRNTSQRIKSRATWANRLLGAYFLGIEEQFN